jgi:hypothetical protein
MFSGVLSERCGSNLAMRFHERDCTLHSHRQSPVQPKKESCDDVSSGYKKDEMALSDAIEDDDITGRRREKRRAC